MAGYLNQRRAGQRGNTNRGHRTNRLSSLNRGGNPHVGGAGRGKKAGGSSGCLSVFCLLVMLPASVLALVMKEWM